MVVSYRLFIVTIALSLAVQPQFAIECLRLSIRQGGGSLLVKILGCFLWSTSLIFGSAESEHTRLSNREIIFEDFHDMSMSRTDRRTDDFVV